MGTNLTCTSVGFFKGLLSKQTFTAALVVVGMALLGRRIALLFKHTSLRTHVQFNGSGLKSHLFFGIVHQKDVAGAEDVIVVLFGGSVVKKLFGHRTMFDNTINNCPESLV